MNQEPRDIKEIVGVLMRVVGGDEISLGEVMDLSFDAEGDLQEAANDAYIRLLQFAHDREERLGEPLRDQARRHELARCLERIVNAANERDLHGLPASTGMAGRDP